MKKCRYFIFTGTFIVVTVLLCNIYKDNVPPKDESFKSPDQIIHLLNNNDIKVMDNDGNSVNTRIYNECLSFRKRVTNDNLNYSRLKLKKSTDFSYEDKEDAINAYKENYKNLKGIEMPKGIKAEKFVGTATNGFYNHNISDSSREDNIELTIIFIKEDNGYVIDGYYVNYPGDNKGNTVESIS